MSKQSFVVLIASLAIVGGALIFRSQWGGSQKFDLSPYHALGAGVAEETAKLLRDKGQVLVISRGSSEFEDPAIEAQLKSFLEALRKKGGVTVVTTLRIKQTPGERMASGGTVPPDQFLNALREHANIGAVICFCGFPQLTKQGYETLRQSGAKVVVVSGYDPRYRMLLEAQVIHLAIVPQLDRSAAPTNKPRTLLEWFGSEFEVITPDNAANLPPGR